MVRCSKLENHSRVDSHLVYFSAYYSRLGNILNIMTGSLQSTCILL